MTDRISIGLLIALPLMVTMGVSVPQSHVAALVVGVLVVLSLRLRSPFLILFGLYAAAWMSFVYTWGFLGGRPAVVFVNTNAIIFLILAMVFFLVILHAKAEDALVHDIICVSALVQAILGLLQWYDMDPVHRLMALVVNPVGYLDWKTPVGTMWNPNWLGAYLSISLPFFWRRKWFLAGLPVAVCLLLTSSAPVIAGLAGVCFLAFGWLGLGIAGIAGLGYVMAFDHQHLAWDDFRIRFWKQGLKMIGHTWHSILVGWGPGISWQPDNHLHNQYLQTLFNYGAIGLGLMAGYIASTLKSSRRLVAAVIIIAVNLAGNSPLNVVPVAMLVLTVMALIERERMSHGLPEHVR